jgi:aspartate/glutamate racemase
VPTIHIADPTGQAMRAAGLNKVALSGTRPVMQMGYIKDRIAKNSKLRRSAQLNKNKRTSTGLSLMNW